MEPSERKTVFIFQKEPLVSVVITTYNRAGLLRQAIESVLNQTYNNTEIIVVDDGSTDDTEQVVKSFNSPKIQYIWTENWGGPARPRNIGIREARGEYIAFCDDDDVWFANKLERSLQVLSNGRFKIAFTDVLAIDIEGQIIAGKKSRGYYLPYLYPSKIIKRNSKRFLLNNVITLSSVIVSSDIRRELVFNEDRDFIACEDGLLWLKLNQLYDILFINETLVWYRVSNSGISNNAEKRLKLNLRLLDEVEKWQACQRSTILASKAFAILKYLLRKGNMKIGRPAQQCTSMMQSLNKGANETN